MAEIDYNTREYLAEQRMQKAVQKAIKQGLEQGISQGITQGISQGIKQGLEQGIEQGKNSRSIALAKKYMAAGHSAQEAADFAEIDIKYLL